MLCEEKLMQYYQEPDSNLEGGVWAQDYLLYRSIVEARAI